VVGIRESGLKTIQSSLRQLGKQSLSGSYADRDIAELECAGIQARPHATVHVT
jgi:hypothetical protein